MLSGILIVWVIIITQLLLLLCSMVFYIRACIYIYSGISLDCTRLYIPGLYSGRVSIDVYGEYTHTHSLTHSLTNSLTHSLTHSIYTIYTILYLSPDRLVLTSLRPMGTLESPLPCTTSTHWAATSTWPPSWRWARSSRTTTRELGVVVFYCDTDYNTRSGSYRS